MEEDADNASSPKGQSTLKRKPGERTQDEVSVAPRTLVKARIKFPALPSPGAIQGCRVAIRAIEGGTSCDAYVASGAGLFHLRVPLGEKTLLQGKGDLYIPGATEDVATSALKSLPHHSEIQSIALGAARHDQMGSVLASVDAFGRVVVTPIPPSDSGTESQQPYSFAPPGERPGEGGWSGIAFCPENLLQVATAQFLGKRLDVFEGDRHVRSLKTLHNATALSYLCNARTGGDYRGGIATLAVTEGPYLSIWDPRAGERGGCVERQLSTSGGNPLYAVACSQDSASGLVAVGGAERLLCIFDTRKWRVRSKWTGCLKYEMTGISFSSIDPTIVYVSGLDYEVACGQWTSEGTRGSSGRLFSFRGDSRWCGFSRDFNSDLLGGWCQSGYFFAASVVACRVETKLDSEPLQLD